MAQTVRDAGRRTSTRDGALDRWARRALHTRLRELSRGQIVLVDAHRTETFGEQGSELSATLQVLDFSEHAVGEGADASAAAYIEARGENGDTPFGVGRHTNITTASLRAVISAVNRLG